MIEVVCGIVYKGDKIFLCRRSPHKSMGGFWEFPGGKIEPLESPEIALQRELQEELSMSVSVQKYFTTVIHKYDDFTIKLIAYTCQFVNAEFNLTDHDAYEWLTPNQIITKKLTPADIPIADKLK